MGGDSMTVYKFRTPVSEEEARRLRVGDELYLSGRIVTARDQAHARALKWWNEGKPIPVSFEGLGLFHSGPLVEKTGDRWRVVCAGPTTSARMESVEARFLEAFKPRIIIGKGGMGSGTAEALMKVGAAYCSFTGGAGLLVADAVKEVEAVEWLDLGVPEALWVLRVEGFGPLIVAMDASGGNLYADVARKVEENRAKIYERIGLKQTTSL